MSDISKHGKYDAGKSVDVVCILHKAVHEIAKTSDNLDRLYGFQPYSD